MSYAQMIEEMEYSESARYDRFDGFDRGDTDFDDSREANQVSTVIARESCAHGRLILTKHEDFNDGFVDFTLRFSHSDKNLYSGDDEATARRIAAWWLKGARA